MFRIFVVLRNKIFDRANIFQIVNWCVERCAPWALLLEGFLTITMTDELKAFSKILHLLVAGQTILRLSLISLLNLLSGKIFL